MLSHSQLTDFKDIVWDYYAKNRRELPWRQAVGGVIDPYYVLVSELMLQQTQVQRVIPKFEAFITQFPNIQSLASAPLSEVLIAWSGLGYNRRAKYLWLAAQSVVNSYGAVLPNSVKELVTLPGVGPNTAGAIVAYAWNKPVVFIETNIRSVYIHHFFADRNDVHDNELIPLIEQTLDIEQPRDWYWALMDYGTYLKATKGNAARRSQHHTLQSAFVGSKRQIRGKVLRLLTTSPRSGIELKDLISDDRLGAVLDDLLREGMIQQIDGNYHL